MLAIAGGILLAVVGGYLALWVFVSVVDWIERETRIRKP